MKKALGVLSTAAISGLVAAAAMSSTAFAATDAYLVKDNNTVYSYSVTALQTSFLDSKMGKAAPLYEDFKAKLTSNGFFAFHDSKTGFVDYKAIQDAFIANRVGFNVDAYTENATAKVAVDKYKDASVANGSVVYTDKGTQVDPPVIVETIKVESATAISETAIQVKGLNKEVKEADLKDKKITLKAGDVSLTATYVATSITTDGKANFILDSEKKLTDAVTYTVSTDWASFTIETFMAKTAATTYVNKVEVLTKAVPANPASTIYFTAKDQYGENIALAGKVGTLHVKGTINGVPFKTGELDEANKEAGKFGITVALKEGDKVTLSFTNTINTKEVEVGNAAYTVAKAEDSVATTVSDMKATYLATVNGHTENNEAKEVLPTDQVKLTVKVSDQFGNPKDNAQVRWVVEEGKDLITQTNDTAIVEVSDAANFTFKASKAGKVKVSAYNVLNGQKVTYEVTIGAKALTSLTLDNPNAVNAINQDETITKVVTPSPGANLTAEMIKFDVKATKTTVDVTPADVQVTAKLRGGTADNKNDIVIVVKSTKPGKYTVTPYVGESLEKATAKVAGFDVTTTIDTTVTKMDDITFDALELKTGKEIKKDVTFRNKHNEVVVVDAPAVTVVTPTGSLTAIVTKDVTDAKNPKNVLTLANATKGTYQVTLLQNSAFKSFTLTFADSTFTKVDAGADITGVVAGDPNTKAKDQAIKFLDQDNKEMAVKASDLSVAVTGPTGQTVTAGDLVKLADNYGFNEAGVDQFHEATGANIVKGFRVQPAGALAQGVYTVKISNADGKIADTFTVTVGAARVAKTVEVTPVATSVALNGQTKVKIVPKDQYGEFIANIGGVAIEVLQGDHFTKGNVTPINKDGGNVDGTHPVAAYEVSLTGTAKGTNDVVVNVKNGDTLLATNKVSMTVDAVANLVSSVEVDKNDIKALYSTQNAGTQVQLKAIAKDAAGAVIPVDNADLSWTKKSVTGKVGADDATIANVGEVGLHTGLYTAAQNFKGTVTIEVRTANMKVGEITLNFDNAAPTPKAGTTAIENNTPEKVVDADTTKAGIQVALDGVGDKDAEANGVITLKVTAKDQFGAAALTNITTANTVVMAGDTSVVTPKVENGTITLTAKGVGTSNVYVQYNGDTIVLEVAVNKDAADKAAAANQAAAELAQAKQALTDKIAAVATAESGKIEGVAAGNQIVGSKATLDLAKTAAEQVLNNAGSTTQILTQATSTLNDAITAYNNAKVVDISSNLVAPTLSMAGTKTGSITGVAAAQGETLNVTSAATDTLTVDAVTGLAVTGVKAGPSVVTVQVKNAAGNVIKTGTVTVTVAN